MSFLARFASEVSPCSFLATMPDRSLQQMSSGEIVRAQTSYDNIDYGMEYSGTTSDATINENENENKENNDETK